jgi:hypothetical protein
MEARTRRWLVGCVAVNLSRQNPPAYTCRQNSRRDPNYVPSWRRPCP